MQLHQVIVSANPGDAITDTALEIRALLRQIGPSEIYSLYAHPDLQNDIKKLHELPRRQTETLAGDVIIFHASIGEPDVTDFVRNRPERLIVMYHNISPPDRFLPFDPRKGGLLAAGRIELASLNERASAALTFSEYNAKELIEMGFRDVRVMPLIVDVSRLLDVEPDQEIMEHFQTRGKPVFLFVGQMLPHKRPDLLIQAYYTLSTYLIPEASLILVGNHLLPKYAGHLTHQINELNLNLAWMTNSVPLEKLVAFYRSADVFVTMSEHEGFCVPLLEAMGFDLPVLARNCAAIPETMAGAGVLLPEDAGIEIIAEAMNELATNGSLRRELTARGALRVEEFDPDVARGEILNNILAVATA